jgi:hypothetical protein
MERCGLGSYDLEQGPVSGPSEHDSEILGSIKSLATISFPRTTLLNGIIQ